MLEAENTPKSSQTKGRKNDANSSEIKFLEIYWHALFLNVISHTVFNVHKGNKQYIIPSVFEREKVKLKKSLPEM